MSGANVLEFKPLGNDRHMDTATALAILGFPR